MKPTAIKINGDDRLLVYDDLDYLDGYVIVDGVFYHKDTEVVAVSVTGNHKELTIKQFHDLQKAKVKRAEKKFKENLEKFKDADPTTFVECKICGFRASVISNHLSQAHGIKAADYKAEHNSPVASEAVVSAQRERSNDVTNPWYNHGGKYSPFSKASINYSPEVQKRAIQHSMLNSNNPFAATKLETYLRQGMTEEQAAEKVAERQRTFSLEICIQKHGEEEGQRIFHERQERWLASMRQGAEDVVG